MYLVHRCLTAARPSPAACPLKGSAVRATVPPVPVLYRRPGAQPSRFRASAPRRRRQHRRRRRPHAPTARALCMLASLPLPSSQLSDAFPRAASIPRFFPGLFAPLSRSMLPTTTLPSPCPPCALMPTKNFFHNSEPPVPHTLGRRANEYPNRRAQTLTPNPITNTARRAAQLLLWGWGPPPAPVFPPFPRPTIRTLLLTRPLLILTTRSRAASTGESL